MTRSQLSDAARSMYSSARRRLALLLPSSELSCASPTISVAPVAISASPCKRLFAGDDTGPHLVRVRASIHGTVYLGACLDLVAPRCYRPGALMARHNLPPASRPSLSQ